jgi:hypothetical protein
MSQKAWAKRAILFPLTRLCDLAHSRLCGSRPGISAAREGVAAVASLEKMHILVYSLFFPAVIRLGVFYRPVQFRSHPPLRMLARSREWLIDHGRTELLSELLIMRANSKGR